MDNQNSFRNQKVALNNLLLWDENARFPDKYFSQPEEKLIEYFLSKKDFKIKELTEAIVKDFDLPQLEKFVIFEDENKLIVLEGNRRLTALKLLANPNLIQTNDNLKNFFVKNKSTIKISEEYVVECLITNDKEAGFRYIDRKHSQGNNEVNWGDTERAHYNQRRGKAKKDELFKIALTKVIKDLNIPTAIQEQILGHGYVTTFYRIVNSSSAWKIFGFKLNEKDEIAYSDADFKDKLKVIILNVLQQRDFLGNKINSRSMNKNQDIEKYLNSIKKEDFPKVETEVKKNTHTNIFGEQNITVSKPNTIRSNPKSTSRSYLIPKTCIFSISEPKINNIYRELKDDLLLDDSNKSVPNAVGVLFRVFLEISLDYFLDKEGLTVSKNDTVHTKIPKVVAFLKNNNIANDKQLKAINKVASCTNSSTNSDLLSIENFHQYVHSYKEQPTSSALKLKWDNLQEFFEILWGYINKKQSQGKK